MDTFALSLLLTAFVLVAFFLLSTNKLSSQRHATDPQMLPRNDGQNSSQQMQLNLDQQTRFVESPKRKPYRLLNDAEQELYHRLREAMPNMQIFAQIGVAQLAQLRGRREAISLMPMSGRGVDFVVCDNDFAIIAAIELAWPTNNTNCPEEEKRSALQSLGIPLIVFRPNDLPDAEIISKEIADAIIRRNRLEVDRSKPV